MWSSFRVKAASLFAAVVVNVGLAVGLHALASAAQAPAATLAAGGGGPTVRVATAAPAR
jgi:hypothetical protein